MNSPSIVLFPFALISILMNRTIFFLSKVTDKLCTLCPLFNMYNFTKAARDTLQYVSVLAEIYQKDAPSQAPTTKDDRGKFLLILIKTKTC